MKIKIDKKKGILYGILAIIPLGIPIMIGIELFDLIYKKYFK